MIDRPQPAPSSRRGTDSSGRRRLRHPVRPGRRRPGQRRRRARHRGPRLPARRARPDAARGPAATPARPRLGAAGARRLRRRAQDRRPRRARATPASTRRRSSASAPTSPPARWCRRPPTARRCARCPGFAADPHAYVKLWKHHAAQPQADRINALAAQARRGLAAPLRRADLLGVGVRQGPAAARGGPGGLRRDRRTGSRPPTGSSGSSAGRYVRNACTAGYKGIFQDGTYPTRDFLAALNPDFADFVADKLDARDRPARRGRRPAHRARPPRGPGCPRASRSRSATSTPTSPRPPPQAIEPGQMVAIMGTSTCHVMNGDVLREVPGMCGVVDGGITAGLWGYEAGQSGVGDIFGWFVTHPVPPAYADAEAAERGMSVHELLTELAATQAGRRARPGRAGLAQRQPLGAGRPRALRAGRRADPGDPARGHLPRAARGDRVRHPHASSRRSARPACRSPSSSSPAACSRTRCSCRSTPTSWTCRSR